MKKCFFIVFGFGLLLVLVLGSCQKKVAPFSSQKTDSIRIDTITIVDSIYFIDPTFINQLYECNQKNELIKKNNINWSYLFDSLKKISPIIKTITKVKKEAIFIDKKEILTAPVKVEYKYKVHPITYVSFGFAIIFLFAFVICFKLLYKILKEKQK